MKAKKENKVYTVDETQKQRYLDTGFDIYSDEGELLEHSPLKLIKYSEYDKVFKEKDALQKELDDLGTDDIAKQLVAVKKENTSLKKELTKIKEADGKAAAEKETKEGE
ncbi:hypothetical protein [Enterococcus sp. AZ103]|uniref:hypothetical protein n=1 Tax=Enterococcus sp. AZ103 TaxID=2774628 RepID=UPI003F24C903